MHAPCVSHWQVVKRILCYFKHTMDYGLHITSSPSPLLYAFMNADWAACPDNRKETGGYCVFYGKNLICWSSKKQPTIARSSIEIEYKALANATCELLWVQPLLSELGMFLSKPPTFYCDNLGATYLIVNPIMHFWTKHVVLIITLSEIKSKPKHWSLISIQQGSVGGYFYQTTFQLTVQSS